MPAALFWPLALASLLLALLWPLLRRRPAVVPLALPLTYLAAEIMVLQWFLQGGWTASAVYTALLSFVFVGCVLIYQAFARRRWFVFRGGGFLRDEETYASLALALRQALQQEGLPPATAILRYDGWLGLTVLAEESEKRLLACLDEALAESKWRRFGSWQLFFGVQGAVLVLALLRNFWSLL